MSTLTIDSTYAGGLSGAINDADAAGHDLILLQPGVYAADTVVASDRSSNPNTRITLRPVGSSNTVALGTTQLDINAKANLCFHNLTFAGGLITSPQPYTTSLLLANSNITFTPVVSDEPIPRVRLRDPNAASQTESLAVTVTGRDVEVTGLGTDASSRVTTTANSIITFLNAQPTVTAIFTSSLPGVETGVAAVRGGLPWVSLTYTARSLWVLEDTTDVEVIGCHLAQFKCLQGCRNIYVGNNYIRTGGNAVVLGAGSGERMISNMKVIKNRVPCGYGEDVVLVRRHDGVVFDGNVFENAVKAEGEANHVDTLQCSFGGRALTLRNNRFIDQEGQCLFICNYDVHNTLIENNVIHQYNSAGEISQFNSLHGAAIRNNTWAVSGFSFSTTTTSSAESSDVVFSNNIANRCSRVTGGTDASFVHTYNLVDAGTNWVWDATDIDAPATYVSAGYPNWNYHLDPASRGVNEGSSTPVTGYPAPSKDLDGVARPQAGTVDMGAYEQ